MMLQKLKLCTWNIQLGLDLQAIFRALGRHPDFADLDLLALQEASVHAGEQDAQRIAAALGPGYASYQVTAHHLRGRPQANALIWQSERVHIAARESIALPTSQQVPLTRRERALLAALPRQARAMLALHAQVEGEELRLYVAHLDVIGFGHKREQFKHILRHAQSGAAGLTIVSGDFNTFRLRSRPSWSDLAAAARAEGFADLTSEIVYTHRIRPLRLRQKLDAILVRRSRPFTYRSWTLDIPGSDHLPVFAELVLA